MSDNSVNDANETALKLVMDRLVGNADPGSGIDFHLIAKRIVYKPRLILLVALGITILATPFIVMMKDMYEVRTVLAPVETDKTTRMAALSNQIMGGFDPTSLFLGGGSGNTKTNKALATLRSRRFIVDFISAENIKKVLFAERWDSEKQAWSEGGVLARIKNFILRQSAQSNEPKDTAAYNYFVKKVISIEQDRKTNLITLHIKLDNPELAMQWAQALPERLNEYYRKKEKAEAERSIQYLQDQISKTSLVDMHKVLYDLVQKYTQTVILANTTKEFVFEVIDPPYLPVKPEYPNRILLIIVVAMLGLITGSAASYIIAIRCEIKGNTGGKNEHNT